MSIDDRYALDLSGHSNYGFILAIVMDWRVSFQDRYSLQTGDLSYIELTGARRGDISGGLSLVLDGKKRGLMRRDGGDFTLVASSIVLVLKLYDGTLSSQRDHILYLCI